MLRELVNIFRSSDPLRELGKQFTEMLSISRELTLRAGKVFFEGQDAPEERSWIYQQDVQVNALQRRIRKQVIAHLSLGGNSADLPYCLLLISLVKDVERIGDYAKNLTEISEFFTGPLPDDSVVDELREIRQGVETAFAGVSEILEQADKEAAMRLIHVAKDMARRCDILVVRAAQSFDDSSTAVAVVLATRYYKRIGGHVLNVLSSVVMPLHKIDYYDEDSLPEDLKTGD